MSMMIKKILVVDDDFLIRKWFVLLLKQSACCEAEILQAENGRQALNILQEQSVDLVITDIKMPVMDGISLIQRLRAEPESPQIVVLSSYDEYAYVRAALKEGVLDYLLKGELEQGSIDAMLEMAEKILQESKRKKNIGQARIEIQRRSHLLRDYIDRGIGDGREIAQTLSGKLLEPPYEVTAYYLDKLKGPLLLDDRTKDILQEFCQKYADLCCLAEYKNDIIFFFAKDPDVVEKVCSSTWSHALYMAGKFTLSGGIQRTVHSWSEMFETLTEMAAEIVCLRFYGRKTVPAASKENTSKKVTYQRFSLNTPIAQNHMEEVKQELLSEFARFKRELLPPKQLINSCIALAFQYSDYIRNFIGESETKIAEETITTLKSAYDIQTVEEAMLSLVNKVKLVSDTNCRYSPAIEKSIQYIAANYMERLSLEHISSRVYLNKSYFSELFKKETGINYNDYINQVRIQKACEFLLTGQYSLSEVAQMVGFSDQNYFSKVFKRIMGESPKKYQMREHE